MNRVVAGGLVITLLLVLVLIGSLVAGLGGGEDQAPITGPDAEEPVERVRVEVLNAAGISGLARAATDRLRAAGFDVVYYGNAAGFSPDTSLVIARTGDRDNAEDVADAADIRRVLARPDSTRYVDVSVIIGADWEGIPEPEAVGDSAR